MELIAYVSAVLFLILEQKISSCDALIILKKIKIESYNLGLYLNISIICVFIALWYIYKEELTSFHNEIILSIMCMKIFAFTSQ